MEKIAAPRGTADIVPPESARWSALETTMRETAGRFGYGEIRTPIFESTDLFVRGVGETTDIVEKEMYSFADKGDRNLTLRPEWTAPVVRAALERGLLGTGAGAQRLFYIGPIFRYERPQAGRYRQAHQFGVECFGFAEPEADVEVIALACDLLRGHGIGDAVVRVNTIGDVESRAAYRERLLAHFRPHAASLSEDSQRRLERNPLRLLDSKAPEDRALVAAAPRFAASLNDGSRAHFARVRAGLDRLEIAYTLDEGLVRGLDYYTHTVFEITSARLGAQSAVCGGGRYDGLVASLGGAPTPAVGFGLGIERFLMMLASAAPPAPRALDGFAAIGLDLAAREALLPVAEHLRRAGRRVVMDYDEPKLLAHFKRADRRGLRAALVAAPADLARGVVTMRDLPRRVQDELPFDPAEPAALARAAIAAYDALPQDLAGLHEDRESA